MVWSCIIPASIPGCAKNDVALSSVLVFMMYTSLPSVLSPFSSSGGGTTRAVLSLPSTGVDGGTDSTCVYTQHTDMLTILGIWTD